MTSIGRATALALCGMLCNRCATRRSAKDRPADLLLQNGRIYTVNAAQPVVESVAVREGRIERWGTTADLQHWSASPRW